MSDKIKIEWYDDMEMSYKTKIVEPENNKKVTLSRSIINHMLCEIIKSKNPRLTAECMAKAFRLIDEPISITARRYGKTKAWISNLVVKYCDLYELPSFKTEEARMKYREQKWNKEL